MHVHVSKSLNIQIPYTRTKNYTKEQRRSYIEFYLIVSAKLNTTAGFLKE